MIDVYALEPDLVATWARRSEYRYIHDKFGLGTPRAMLEFPEFTRWKGDVHEAANKLGLTETDWTRLTELFRLLAEHKCKRPDAAYCSIRDWLQNAEAEHNRRQFAAILATKDPRGHCAVITENKLGEPDSRWDRPTGATPHRRALELATVLASLLVNASQLHLIDPHFGPENGRHREVLRAVLQVLADHGVAPEVVIYCSDKATKEFFESEAEKMSAHLPVGLQVDFVRLRNGRECLHNRYILSNLGGVTLGAGLDQARQDAPDQTDDVTLMPREQYLLRWDQYVKQANGAFTVADRPHRVIGASAPQRREGGGKRR